ncbi:hypothetical protein [Bradyrhizobium sp. USDA 4454]
MDLKTEELCAHTGLELFTERECSRLAEWREEQDALEALWWGRAFAKASERFPGHLLYTLLVDGEPTVIFGEHQAYHLHSFDCLTGESGALEVRPATQVECDQVADGLPQIASKPNQLKSAASRLVV